MPDGGWTVAAREGDSGTGTGVEAAMEVEKMNETVQSSERATMTEQERNLRLDAVEHVVHDYCNFISSGLMAITQRHKNEWLSPPANTHVANAFLLNCRTMADFFLNISGRGHNDIMSKHYREHLNRKERAFKPELWQEAWSDPMDKQLFHLTYDRVTNPKPWAGFYETPIFFETVQDAWKRFLSQLVDPYKSRFEEEITERLDPTNPDNVGFINLDLTGNQKVDKDVGHP